MTAEKGRARHAGTLCSLLLTGRRNRLWKFAQLGQIPLQMRSGIPFSARFMGRSGRASVLLTVGWSVSPATRIYGLRVADQRPDRSVK